MILGQIIIYFPILLLVADKNIKFTIISGLLNKSNFSLKKLVQTKYKTRVNLLINPKKFLK